MRIIRSYFNSSLTRLVFLTLIITIVFTYSSGRFIFVHAFNAQVNLVPSLIQIEGENSDDSWQNINSVLNQDLFRDSDIVYFNTSNSAYIIRGEPKVRELPSEPSDIPNEIIPVDEAEEQPEEEQPEEISELDTGKVLGEEVISEPIIELIENQLISEPNIMPESVEALPEVLDDSSEAKEVSLLNKLFGRAFGFFSFASVKAQENATLADLIIEDVDEIEEGREGDEEEENIYSSAIIFSDFFVPLEYQENGVGNINLRMSLAAESELTNNEIIIEYNTEDTWEDLGSFKSFNKISNKLNSDYFQFALPKETSWEDLEDLKIRISHRTTDKNQDNNLEIYLDALWLEMEYNEGNEKEEIEEDIDEMDEEEEEEEILPTTIKGVDFDFDLMSEKDNFKSTEDPIFEFEFKEKKGLFRDIGAGLVGIFQDEYEEMEILVKLKDAKGQAEVGVDFDIIYLEDGEFRIEFLDRPRQFKPGSHTLEITINKDGETYIMTQDFTWGVLAFNLNKSIYLEGETAYLQMAVLDDAGNTICDADLELEITAPGEEIIVLSTNDGTLIRNSECGPNNIIRTPDYFGYYKTSDVGTYQVKLTAWTINGQREITDSFEVQQILPFEVERIGPTRIYPLADYEMKFIIKANIDFKGEFREYIPESFVLVEQKQNGAIIYTTAQASTTEKSIIWDVNWQEGEEYILSYTFDAPDISPEFYLLGPAEINGDIRLLNGKDSIWENYNFQEVRQWQIASDAIVLESETANTGTSDGSGNFSVTKPATVSDDDYLVVIAGKDDAEEITAVSSGWTRADSAGTTDGNNQAAAIFYKQITDASSEPASYTFDADATEEYSYWIGSLSGIDLTTPEDVAFSGTWSQLANDRTPGATSINTVTDGAYVFGVAYVDADTNIGLPGGSWSTRTETCGGTNCLGVVSQIVATFGASGVAEFINVGSTDETYVGQYAFRPAPPPADDVTVTATGTQTVLLQIPSDDNYVGGAFVLTEEQDGSTITSITITESGTVDAQNDINDIRLYYDLDSSSPYNCESESFSITDTRFGATSTSFDATNGTSTFSGSVAISTVSTMCVYTVLDIGSGASASETLEIEIDTPSSDVVLSSGTVTPNTSVEIPDTTTLVGSVTVSATGTQTSSINIPSTNNYIGGGFVFVDNINSRNITSISITENGTVDAQNSIENIKLYYDLDIISPYDCTGESYAITDLRFGATSTSFDAANGTSTFSGTVGISTTSTMCVYVMLDVGSSAINNQTIEILINDPSSEVTVSSGSVGPNSAVGITDSTTLSGPTVSATANEQYKSNLFTTITNQGWTNENQINLNGLAGDMNATSTTQVDLYFNLLDESGTYVTATTVPASSCSSGTAYESCSDKLWKVDSTPPVPWYDTDWGYRKKITINASQVATTTSAFPVLATSTDSNMAFTDFGGHMGSSTAGDIIITDDDGQILLDFEREFYSSSTGEIVLWIETDISTSTNKDIYIYYGNSGAASDASNPSAVWDSDYIMVQHLDESTGTHYDSTSNNNDSTTVNVADQNASGHIDGADEFNGGDEIDISASASINALNYLTVEAWVKIPDNTATDDAIIDFYDAGNDRTYLYYDDSTYGFRLYNDLNNSNSNLQSTGFIPDNNTWHHLAWTVDGTYWKLFIDGNELASDNVVDTLSLMTGAVSVSIGRRVSNDYDWNGMIDEVRISNIRRTEEWIETSYNNQNDVNNFLTISSLEETPATASFEGIANIITIPDRGSSTDSSLGYKWQLFACNDLNECSSWDKFNTTLPNFKVDTNAPSAPGNLTLSTTTATTITLNFGSQASDINFSNYKIYYKTGLSGVSVTDSEHSDSNLADVDYNSAATTTITNLQSDTKYVINIWAYDLAGNKTAATEIVVTTALAPHARARSVQFLAGNYSSPNGLSGQDSNTDQTFSTFNFSLAETEVEIRNAYIIFESQFEAYHANSSNYTGYELNFDVCAEPCTADAILSSDKVTENNSSVLSYDENDSNQVRILYDVTSETQLAAYIGDNANMEAQFAYKLNTGSATSSIASAKAILVVTYAFNEDDSTNFTNTIVYPLESETSGDSGTMRASSTDDCTKNSDCPTFDYNMYIPELGTKLSQWFSLEGVNDSHSASDVEINVNIQGSEVDSDSYYHEANNGGEQGNFPKIIFDNVFGFSESTDQVLEYYLSSGGSGEYYLLGGEVHETYTAAKSANTKVRTVSFPMGILTNGQSVTTASSTMAVYFPENGNGSGVVDIQKAWFRVISNNSLSGDYALTLSSKVGDNAQSGNYIYNINVGDEVVKPSYKIIHVIPSTDYSELESANGASPKNVNINTTNSSANMGGVSVELMITYTYTDESSGYLSSINLYGGQLDDDANAQSGTSNIAEGVFPEIRGDETLRAAGLLGSFLFTDSEFNMPSDWFTMDINLATSSPVCDATSNFAARTDGMNGFVEYYKDVTSAIFITDEQSYTACFANDNGDASAGAKMNSILYYTYQWDAPPSELTQNDWRWYENIDSSSPTIPKAAENTSISGVNIGDIVRLRMNIEVSNSDLATSTQSFKLQFADGSDCTSISSSTWINLGGVADSIAWRGYNNPDPADGSTLSSSLLTSSIVAETYEEENSSASNPRAIERDAFGEWDWVIYNNSATSTTNYCFRMVQSNGSEIDAYMPDGYPILTTAASNTAPSVPASLAQYRSSNGATISNLAWIDEDSVALVATATDPDMSEVVKLYFEIASSTGNFTTGTSTPSGACISGTAYDSCSSKIWIATSTLGDYRSSAFVGTTTISGLLDYNGYKWQVLSCDDGGACSNWTKFNTSVPNFRVDTTAPDVPGSLVFATSTPTSITLNLGATSTEENFLEYKIFYKVGSSGVTESDAEHEDTNFSDQDFSLATSTLVIDLSADTEYVFNIWAYDQAGNKASATPETIGTTTVSSNPPTGYIMGSSGQKVDGSGIVDVTILVDDPDNNDTLRAKLMYHQGDTCDFSGAYSDPTLDEIDINIQATYGDPDIDNDYDYQVGTTSNWIITSPGKNYVFFDWFGYIDESTADGDYCLGLVVNDGLYNQIATHTLSITLDNVAPTKPGWLLLDSKDFTSVTLDLGTTSTDTNFSEYKIFYKPGTSGVTESDSVWDKTDDINLDEDDFNGFATTTITGLSPNIDYVFNIWAYDAYGNKASSSIEFTVTTNAVPTNISANNQYLSDGATAILNNSWIDESSVMLKASAHDQDSTDLVTFFYELITATGTYSSITDPPSGFCADGTDYVSCNSKIWGVSTSSSELPTDWYDGDWLYRKQITINSSYVATTAPDFPVLVKTTDSDLSDEARADAYDILFTDSTGTTTLNFERKYFNPVTGELTVWVKSNISSTTDTILYMYYGNSAASTDLSTTTGVWDSDYVNVLHLDENVIDESTAANVHQDSTTNNNDGDQDGNNEATGYIYQGQEFDGLDDLITVDDSSSLDLTDAVTLEFWINGTTELSPLVLASSTVYTSAGASTYTVPSNVSEITVKSWGGGGGGGGGGNDAGETGGGGGGGGFAQGIMSVTPTETLSIRIGGGGGLGVEASQNGAGGGGGGYSAVLRDTTFLIQAGGGGGGGGNANEITEDGGGGGGGSGADGVNGTIGLNAGCPNEVGDFGSGGTTSGGGDGGSGCSSEANGANGQANQGGAGGSGVSGTGGGGTGGTYGGGTGGSGQAGTSNNDDPGGGGGGGGQYGGGGAEAGNNEGAGGGGGGSGKTDGLSDVTTSAGTSGATDGTAGVAANNSDSKYVDPAGDGGAGGNAGSGSDGSDGMIEISFSTSTPVPITGKQDAYAISLDSDQKIHAYINNQIVSASISSGWHHVVVTYNRLAGGSDEIKLYVDGVLQATGDYSAVINTNSNDLYIGSSTDGIIDEFRVSNSARSLGWLKTQYNNQSDINNFLTIASESTVTSYYETALVINVPDNPQYSSGYKWQTMACDDDGDCTSWGIFNATTPNFKIDTTDPSTPGALLENSKTSNTITLDFGAQTDEDNFTEYKIYYSTTSPISEVDNLHSSSTDPSLKYIDYYSNTDTTISNLNPLTTYYFNIWAYDIVGHKASSTITAVTTSDASSTPGVVFYAKDDRAIYYQVWDGADWGGEQSSGNVTAVGDNIRHIRAIRSDTGAKVGLLLKTWDGSNQEWYGAVYRFAADDFVDVETLGATWNSATNNDLITSCIAPLSGGEFFVIRNDNASDGAIAHSWDGVNGWTDEGVVPGTDTTGEFGVMNGCELVRRPSTDNYLLLTFDDVPYVGSMYYDGGSTFDNTSGSWSSWSDHSDAEEDIDNFVGGAFFDPSDNTQGALYYSDSSSNDYTYAKYFQASDSNINYGGAQPSPATGSDDWGSDFVHGEFAVDPGSAGLAYFVGRDTGGELNVYQLDASDSTIVWSTATNGDDISSGNLYSHTNNAQTPFASMFYKSGEGVVIGNYSANSEPFYSIINTSGNSLSATSSIEGATSNIYTRVRLFDDPNEDQLLAVLQNDDIDYTAVFFDGGADQFYDTGNQAWTELAVTTGAADADFECTSYAYAKYNSAPSLPTTLEQYKTDASTTIANQAWTDESIVKFETSVIDVDTNEVITIYLQLLANIYDFTTSTNEATFNACASTTPWNNCNSKIWAVASSSLDDYSVVPFTATATITNIATSTIGYKWQVLSCDDQNQCSNWKAFNATQPNFYVDTDPPEPLGALTISSKTSETVTLSFGSAANEPAVSFLEYKIFYKIGSSGVTESDNSWTQVHDADLASLNFGGTSDTVITGLSSSTEYVFNIWAYDKAGNIASATPEVSTTTNSLPAIDQTSFLFENDDGADVNSNTAEIAASTTLNNVYIGERFAARVQIENNGGDIKQNNVYKLQYQNFTDSGTWADIAADTEISYSDGLSGSNGNAIITPAKAEASTNDWSNGTWHEGTNQTGNITLDSNEYTELVFMLETSNATTSKTYLLRIFDVTENTVLSNYVKYPSLSTVVSDTIRYSKNINTSLPSNINDLTYYLDPEGYADTATDDSNNDTATSTSNYSVFLYATKHTNDSDAASSTWNGQSSIDTSGNNVVLQVYRFGSTNAWVTVDTESVVGAGIDFTLAGGVNSSLSEYYDSNNWIYWRVYQGSGSQALRTDYYSANFAAPVPEISQLHYQWRKDDGDEDEANWLEDEDDISPSNGPEIGVGSTTRLRVEVVNLGGGSATNYNYRLEYASSPSGCATDPGGWAVVPAAASGGEHFEIADSSYLLDSDITTFQLANSESYTFTAGDVIDDATNASANITLTEGRYTELEYTVYVTNDATIAQTYCFRVTDTGTELENYDIFPSVTLSGNTNIAPAFSVDPTDNDLSGASASTSPTDEGTNVTFYATAGDPEGEDYYLAVCQQEGITPGNDMAPTCDNGSWCISNATASGTQASCVYTAATSTEVNAWYAYACDKVAGFGLAKCSLYSQGSGNPAFDSPFVINHRPDFTLASTTEDFKDPGEDFRVTAYVTDTDVADSADTMTMYVCTTNSIISYAAGCAADTLCSEISTTSPNASCTFSTSTPATAGTYNYYVFVFDDHGLAATPASRSGTYNINNSAPILGALILNSDSDITLNIKGAGDISISTVNVSVQDLNGCQDIESAVGTIYMSNASGGSSCTADDNECYQIDGSNCVKSACDDFSDMIATYTCSADMKYFAVPTDDDTSENNPWKDYNWLSYLMVFDGENYSATTSAAVEVITNVGVGVVEGSIDFGTGFAVGENTGTTNSTTTIENIGNSPIDSNISGIDLASVNYPVDPITVDWIKWGTTTFSYELEPKYLKTTNQLVDLEAPRATATNTPVSDDLYWGIGIPPAAYPDRYEGENSFIVRIDEDDW